MLVERETVITELWRRLSLVTGVKFTARNPGDPPGTENFPAIQFFEMPDSVEQIGKRGGLPVYRRTLTVVVESFIVASSEAACSKELGQFIQKVKREIYRDGPTLNRTCEEITEQEMSRVFRPPAGKNAAGLGIVFKIRYIEDINRLFT